MCAGRAWRAEAALVSIGRARARHTREGEKTPKSRKMDFGSVRVASNERERQCGVPVVCKTREDRRLLQKIDRAGDYYARECAKSAKPRAELR
jgi:hypothetical protein